LELDPVSDEMEGVLCSLPFSFTLYSQIDKMLENKNQIGTVKCSFRVNCIRTLKVMNGSL